jgi:hypothetical protein
MPMFKVTLKVNESIALGSILMTKGVELISIAEISDTMKLSKQLHKKTYIPTKTGKKIFRHPSGKKITDFVYEMLEKASPESVKWNELNKYVQSLGFGKSSVNSAIKRLADQNSIEASDPGYYRITRGN